MPTDPTFDGADLIRIWAQNLTRAEQDEVRCFFLVVEKGIRGSTRGIALILKLLALIFPGGKLFFNVAKDVIEALDEAHTAAECLARIKLKPEKEVI